MRILCTKLPAPLDGMFLEASPWVTLHREYFVVSMLAEPGGRVQLQVLTDDRSLAWFDSTNFMTVDGRLPGNWSIRIGEGGALELAPAVWLAPGFWEAYYDGDVTAADAVADELRTILGDGST
jgi:hypothetical protein